MKQTTFLALLLSLFGLTLDLQAQDNRSPQQIEKDRQKLIAEFRYNEQLRNQNLATQNPKNVSEKSTLVLTNQYNHREAEIMEKLNTEGIPSDFPKYNPDYSNDQYTILMNKWYTANPSLLKKESSNEQK